MQRGGREVLGAFEIAGIPCRVECRNEAFRSLLAVRYAPFASDALPQLSVRVEVTEESRDDAETGWSGPFARIGGADGLLTIEGAAFRGLFDERVDQGWIVQPLDPSPFETFLTAIYASRLLRQGGFLLHAAAVARGRGAYVFFGPSGSGKTTVAELVGEGVITDEIAAIRREGDGYRVFGVPWRGEPRSVPLAGLFRLRKAERTSFTALSPVDTLRQLLPSVFFSRPDVEEVDRFLEIGERLVRTVPGYEMQFAPDRSFWEMMPRLGEGENDGRSL